MNIIGGALKRRNLVCCADERVQPTSSMMREALFDVLTPRIEGARFCDLFAGNGTVGLEALSRGAMQVTFVERLQNALVALNRNITQLPAPYPGQTLVLRADAWGAPKLLKTRGLVFDILFMDPPYYQKEPLLDDVMGLIEALFAARVVAPDGLLVHQLESGSIHHPDSTPAYIKVKEKEYGRTRLVFLSPKKRETEAEA